jgi:ceramide glucosyltransferase
VKLLLYGIGCAAVFYQLLALAAALRHACERRRRGSGKLPGVSILKPIRGLDPSFYEAIRSHARQRYPEFEILFGAGDPEDPAVAEVRRLQAEFPEVPIRFLHTTAVALNRKVATLMELAREARYPVWLVNDSDIEVKPDYLERVVAPLESEKVGIVTCLYRARPSSVAGAWESLGIAVDFMPSVLVARLLGVREFGLGATLVFRAEDLKRVGGFEALADYIADDYQLARHITARGGASYLSEVVVDTHLGDSTWKAVWRHQVRWARTIRVSRGGGFLGLPVTQAGVWALAAAAGGAWWLAGGLAAVRIVAGVVTGAGLIGNRTALWAAPLIPLWDLWAFAVWAMGLAGTEVEWRGGRMKLQADGRIVR